MNAEEFLENKYGLDGLVCYNANAVGSTSVDIVELLEEYHRRKLKLLGIGDVVERSEQLPILDRCGCEEPNEEPIKICMNCNGYIE